MINNFIDRAEVISKLEKYVLAPWYRSFGQNKGMDVMKADWDTLIILDACRYDTLSEVAPNDWPEIECRKSKATNTWNFYKRNFCEGPYNDTVVVTAQPRTVLLREDDFYDVIPVYEENWDEDLGTLPPEIMAKRTIETHDKYPNKRILSHWIQPHYPFIGSDKFSDYKVKKESIWKDLKRNSIDQTDAEVYRAYENTLEYTLPHVSKVVENVQRRVVVSSDHGNAFGVDKSSIPFKIYGHPRDIRIPQLTNIPWSVFKCPNRPTIRGDERKARNMTSDVVDDRLADLGYTNK